MADKQTEADKVAAMKEYRQQHDSAVDRMAALKAARLARDAGASSEEVEALASKKPAKKKTATAVTKRKKKR
jgi:hypothetical protein